MDRFADQVAIVTGAAQGLGRAVALQMAREGASVVLVDRVAGQCRVVEDEIKAEGGQALAVEADLSTHAGAVEMVRRAKDVKGRIDVSVHNVGGTIWFKPFWEYTPEQIEREISKSLWPTLWSCREVIPVMMAQGKGSIVNVGSLITRGELWRVPYGAAKGGVHAMTLCMANELGDTGVRVNCVAPGALDNAGRVVPRNTEPLSDKESALIKSMYEQTIAGTPMRRYGRAHEAAAAICFLASDEASYITGQVLSVGGGRQA